jgi:hypothetical protein
MVFFAQLAHHPDEFTLLPGKMAQGPVASPAFPWNWAQLPHFESGLVDLVTYPNAFAVGSLGSSAGASATAAPTNSLANGTDTTAVSTALVIVRRVMNLFMSLVLILNVC